MLHVSCTFLLLLKRGVSACAIPCVGKETWIRYPPLPWLLWHRSRQRCCASRGGVSIWAAKFGTRKGATASLQPELITKEHFLSVIDIVVNMCL